MADFRFKDLEVVPVDCDRRCDTLQRPLLRTGAGRISCRPHGSGCRSANDDPR